MTTKQVYLVTTGDYSDYHIIGAYSTQELADLAVAEFGGEVEVWSLDEYARELRAGWRGYFVRMTREGDTVELHCNSTARLFRSVPDTCYRFDIRGNLYTEMFARDEAHAVKIANERRVAVLAADAWGKQGWEPPPAPAPAQPDAAAGVDAGTEGE